MKYYKTLTIEIDENIEDAIECAEEVIEEIAGHYFCLDGTVKVLENKTKILELNDDEIAWLSNMMCGEADGSKESESLEKKIYKLDREINSIKDMEEQDDCNILTFSNGSSIKLVKNKSEITRGCSSNLISLLCTCPTCGNEFWKQFDLRYDELPPLINNKYILACSNECLKEL